MKLSDVQPCAMRAQLATNPNAYQRARSHEGYLRTKSKG